MKQILFKALSTFYTGEWYEGWPTRQGLSVYMNIERYEELHYLGRVNPDTICQYTTLDTENGDKIFFGDIIFWGGMKLEVKFIDGTIYACGKNYMKELFDIALESEIIGNIHDENSQRA